MRAVFRAVGLEMGDGEIGSGKGDLGAPWVDAVPGTVRESLGLAARSMPMVVEE